MNVSLTPELEAMVRKKVESGRYTDASEVIHEALRLMFQDERDRFQRLRVAVADGVEQAERGETVEYSPELMDRLTREAIDAALAGMPVPGEVKP